jgi:hypothetical protein
MSAEMKTSVLPKADNANRATIVAARILVISFIFSLVVFIIRFPTLVGVPLALFVLLFVVISLAYLAIQINNSLDKMREQQINSVKKDEAEFLNTIIRQVEEALASHSEEA